MGADQAWISVQKKILLKKEINIQKNTVFFSFSFHPFERKKIIERKKCVLLSSFLRLLALRIRSRNALRVRREPFRERVRLRVRDAQETFTRLEVTRNK